MLVNMSDKEFSQINVLQSVVEKRMPRRNAALPNFRHSV